MYQLVINMKYTQLNVHKLIINYLIYQDTKLFLYLNPSPHLLVEQFFVLTTYFKFSKKVSCKVYKFI